MKGIVYILGLMLLMVFDVSAREWTATEIPMVHLQDLRKYVCDPEGIMSESQRDTADSYLSRLYKESGVQPVFVIVNNVKEGDVFRFAQDIGNQQGVGDKKTNRGLVVVVAVSDKKYFIAPGEGLEKDLTDVECDDIARACIVQSMRANNPNAAMVNTAKAIYNKFKTGKIGFEETSNKSSDSFAGIFFILLAIFIIYMYSRGSNNKGKGGNDRGGRQDRNGGVFGPIFWGNPGHINDNNFGGGFGGGSFGGGGAGGGW